MSSTCKYATVCQNSSIEETVTAPNQLKYIQWLEKLVKQGIQNKMHRKLKPCTNHAQIEKS
jgi:hypothetical protein